MCPWPLLKILGSAGWVVMLGSKISALGIWRHAPDYSAMQNAFRIARLNGGSSGAHNYTPNIDGDRPMALAIDGLIMTRVMLGLNGTAVTGSVTLLTAASRKTCSAIRTNLLVQCRITPAL